MTMKFTQVSSESKTEGIHKILWRSEGCGDTDDEIGVEGHNKATESAGISGVDWNSCDFYSLPGKYVVLPISNVSSTPKNL